jgi:hypothetical protein
MAICQRQGHFVQAYEKERERETRHPEYQRENAWWHGGMVDWWWCTRCTTACAKWKLGITPQLQGVRTGP